MGQRLKAANPDGLKTVGNNCRKNATKRGLRDWPCISDRNFIEKVLCFYPIVGIMHVQVVGLKGVVSVVGKIQRLTLNFLLKRHFGFHDYVG